MQTDEFYQLAERKLVTALTPIELQLDCAPQVRMAKRQNEGILTVVEAEETLQGCRKPDPP